MRRTVPYGLAAAFKLALSAFAAVSPTALPVLTAACAVALPSAAQGVPAAEEPRHHPVYEDANFRVLRVEVPARDSTLLHRHEADYFWIALGETDIVSAVVGRAESRTVASANSLHFSKGPFSHVAHNPGAQPFRNVTIELLFTQTNPRNLCEQVLPGIPLDCAEGTRGENDHGGATVLPSFTTDQLRVSLATIPGGGTLRGTSSRAGTVLMATEESSAAALSVTAADVPLRWTRGVLRPDAGATWEVTNLGKTAARVILAEVR